METDHRQTPAQPKPGKRALESAIERIEFLIDGDAQRLERARGGMLAGLLAADNARHEFSEVARARDGILGAARDNRFRDAAAHALFPVLPQHLGNLRLARSRQKL